MLTFLPQATVDAIFDFVYWFSLSNKTDLDIIKEELEAKKEEEEGNIDYEVSLFDSKIDTIKKEMNSIKKAIIKGVDQDDFIEEMKSRKRELMEWQAKKKDKKIGIKMIDDNIEKIVSDFTEEKKDEWKEMKSREKRIILLQFCTASISENVLTIRTRRTNRLHMFDINTITCDRISALKSKPVAVIEKVFSIKQPKLFQFRLTQEPYSVKPHFYDFKKETDSI